MGYREIMSDAKRLPLDEQLRLVEELLRAIRQTAAAPVEGSQKQSVPFSQLRGALKPGATLPSDAEMADAYTRHLMDKYL